MPHIQTFVMQLGGEVKVTRKKDLLSPRWLKHYGGKIAKEKPNGESFEHEARVRKLKLPTRETKARPDGRMEKIGRK